MVLDCTTVRLVKSAHFVVFKIDLVPGRFYAVSDRLGTFSRN